MLRRAAAACGIALPDAGANAGPAELDWLPPLHDPEAPPLRTGFGVPHVVFNGTHSVSGARPPTVLADAMQRALARAKQRATLAAG
ncbi:hypothetical protein D3C81_1271020 [compost metagenome]